MGVEVLFRGEKGVFRSHWVAGIDRQPYKPPAHISSSIRALKVLLTAHLSIMKTYSRWTWMPSYFQPSRKSSTSVAAPCWVMMLSSSPDQWWPEPAIDPSGWGSGTRPVPVLTHRGRPGHTGHGHSLDWCRQRLICSGQTRKRDTRRDKTCRCSMIPLEVDRWGSRGFSQQIFVLSREWTMSEMQHTVLKH